ncbi:MAG: hypothetical protein V1790_16950 [Planctomycetota bacterium]
MSLHRSHRKHMDQVDAIETKARNRVFKDRERARRDVRMAEAVRAGRLPYPPAVMSWLSRKLDKASTKITSEDIKTLLV